MVAVSGNTFPVKEKIKALGGRWNGDRKCWMVPADKADQAKALVAVAPRTKRSGFAPRASSGFRRFECDDCCDMVTSGTRCWETGLTH